MCSALFRLHACCTTDTCDSPSGALCTRIWWFQPSFSVMPEYQSCSSAAGVTLRAGVEAAWRFSSHAKPAYGRKPGNSARHTVRCILWPSAGTDALNSVNRAQWRWASHGKREGGRVAADVGALGHPHAPATVKAGAGLGPDVARGPDVYHGRVWHHDGPACAARGVAQRSEPAGVRGAGRALLRRMQRVGRRSRWVIVVPPSRLTGRTGSGVRRV